MTPTSNLYLPIIIDALQPVDSADSVTAQLPGAGAHIHNSAQLIPTSAPLNPDAGVVSFIGDMEMTREIIEESGVGHTPGPWHYWPDYYYDNRSDHSCDVGTIGAIKDSMPLYIALVHHIEDGETEANTSLICAAPDLLAACEVAV